MASVEEKLMQQLWAKEAREKAVKAEPPVVVAEKKEEVLGAKAEQLEVSADVAEEVKKDKAVSKAKKEK